MTNELHGTCLFTFLDSLSLQHIREEAITEVVALASDEFREVIEAGELTDPSQIIEEVTLRIQLECDEILVRDEDDQAIAKIVEAAMDKFLANSDLGGADGVTGDRIVGVVWERMEEVAKDWGLNPLTSIKAVIDDLIEEATFRADEEIDAILVGIENDETKDEKEVCDA